MVACWFYALTALGGTETASYDADESVRFDHIAPAPPEPEPDLPWTGGARAQLSEIVGVEAQLAQLGARPEDTVLVSAHLDWGTLVTTTDLHGEDELQFQRNAVRVRSRRLSDGALLEQVTAVDSSGTYNLGDPTERARLCTKLQQGTVGTLTLHPWTAHDAPQQRSPDDTSFLLVDDGNGDRIAVVDLKPGESATVVELVEPADRRTRRQRVRRSMEVTRGDKVVTLSEGDALQRICLEY